MGRGLTGTGKGTTAAASRHGQMLMASALGFIYFAVMSGHLSSMDGLLMARQAYALAFAHAVRFQTEVWLWRPGPVWNSMYGIGLSLLYVPGLLVAAALRRRVPTSIEIPSDLLAFYQRELYQDPLYTVGASWVHVVIVAMAAYLVARLIMALGGSRRAALWGMAFYGLGSSALVYARGDFSQALEGLCWTGAILAAVRVRAGGRTLAACCAATGYAILTRPVEGLLLVPAVVAMALPYGGLTARGRSALKPAFALGLSTLAAIVVTLLVNRARFGAMLTFGYPDDNTWVRPEAWTWLAVLVSPGRGVFWECPALALVPLGAMQLARRGRGRDVLAILVLAAMLLVNTTTWFMWWGGWCWGLRLFTPAIPLLAALAGVGVDGLSNRVRASIPAAFLGVGVLWALPGLVTDILGGFGGVTDVWTMAAYPPYGAWRYLERVFAEGPTDAGAVDILWFRLAHNTSYWSLLVPLVLGTMAAVLVSRSLRASQHD